MSDRSHIERLRDDFPKLLGKARVSIASGWENLVRALCRNLQELPQGDQLQAVQVKEKFGQLRFYLDTYPGNRKRIDQIVRDAEARSKNVCEECGTTEGVRMEATRGWIKSLCDPCRIQRWQRLKERWGAPEGEDNPPKPVVDAKKRVENEAT